MEFEETFKVLQINQRQRKQKEGDTQAKYFYVLNVLDNKCNPCKFYSFTDEMNTRLLNLQLKPLQDILIKFELEFNGTMWNVRLLNIETEF